VALEDEFGERIQVTEIPDRGRTGRFEVTIVPTQQLIYSKDTRGQGKCETDIERREVIRQIRECLDSEK
jgi:hypothetical protein